MIDEFDLTPTQLDALREIGNIGAGNTATALSQVVNKKIDMNVPKVSLIPIDEVPDLVGGPDASRCFPARLRQSPRQYSFPHAAEKCFLSRGRFNGSPARHHATS